MVLLAQALPFRANEAACMMASGNHGGGHGHGVGQQNSSSVAAILARIQIAESMPLPRRFANVKSNLVAGNEEALVESWHRLLRALRTEVDDIAARGSSVIPTIRLQDIDDPVLVEQFGRELRRRGAGIIRGVVSREEALQWKHETFEYLRQNPHTRSSASGRDPITYELYWSPGQVKSRAHPNVLKAQRFAMSFWRTDASTVRRSAYGGVPPAPQISTNHPVAYADRLRIRPPPPPTPWSPSMAKVAESSSTSPLGGPSSSNLCYYVDGGSVERWEPDGYGGRVGTYEAIWLGRWEEHDPWNAGRRLLVASDLYNGVGACSMLRLLQGWIALSDDPPASRRRSNDGGAEDGTSPDDGSQDQLGSGLRVLPALQLTTAYLLLRPFFTPLTAPPPPATATPAQIEAYLDPSNWALESTLLPRISAGSGTGSHAQFTPSIPGAAPGQPQMLTPALHPHLQLHRSLVRVPPTEPGDYVVWHCDAVHGVDTNYGTSSSSGSVGIPGIPMMVNGHGHGINGNGGSGNNGNGSSSIAAQINHPDESTVMYTPACPLTATNALYLARQRKAFLLGHAGPDFRAATGGGIAVPQQPGYIKSHPVGHPYGSKIVGGSPLGTPNGSGVGLVVGEGESNHAGRPGVQDVADAGDEDGLRAMGLLPFDEDDVSSEAERELVRMANSLLFPERFGRV